MVDLTTALGQYMSTLSSDAKEEAQKELQRFIRWYGRERSVQELSPPAVAEYPRQLVNSSGDLAVRLAHIKGFLTYLKRQGLVQASLAAHVRVPKAKEVATGRRCSTESPIQLTSQGLAALKQQLKELKDQRVKVAQDIQTAAADKDVRENAPLEAAREYQGQIHSRIRELDEQLHRAVLMSDGGIPSHRVRLGSVVQVQDVGTGKTLTYTLADPAEADVAQGKLSAASPVGKGLLERSVGEEIEITVPRGTLRYRITSIQR